MPPFPQPTFASSSLPGTPLPPMLQGELRVGKCSQLAGPAHAALTAVCNGPQRPSGVARAGGAAGRLRSAVGWKIGRDSEKRWQSRRAVAVEPRSPVLFAPFASGREPALPGSLPGSAF